MSFLWRTQLSALWERLQDRYLKKSLINRLILKQCLFFLHMHERTLIKSYIVEFIFIINELDKIEVKIENRDQIFYYCILYLLHTRALGKLSSMEANELSRSMRLRIIYSIRKIGNQLTGESHHDDSGQAHFSKEKSNNESSMGILKHRNLCATVSQ